MSEIGDPLAGDVVAQMQSKAGFAGSLDARAVDEADAILARPPGPAGSSRRANRFSQSAMSQSPQRRNRASKATSETSTTPRRRGFRGQLAQRPPAGRIGQDQTQQISRALDVTRAVKRAVPDAPGLRSPRRRRVERGERQTCPGWSNQARKTAAFHA